MIPEEKLRATKVEHLTEKSENLTQLPYEIFFYGKKDFDGFKEKNSMLLEKQHSPFQSRKFIKNWKLKEKFSLPIMIWCKWK